MLCCGSEWINWTKQNLNCLLLLGNVVFVQSLENCTVCTQHSLWLPNWIFYSVCFKSLVCLLKMDASVLGVKKVQIRYKEKQKGKGSHLRYRVQNLKNVYCKHCSLSLISHTFPFPVWYLQSKQSMIHAFIRSQQVLAALPDPGPGHQPSVSNLHVVCCGHSVAVWPQCDCMAIIHRHIYGHITRGN